MRNNYPTLHKIISAHGWKRDYEKHLPLSRFVFRPMGFLATWVAIRIGLTTESVAWLSGVVGISGCVCLISGRESFLPVGIGLLLLFNLLDCVDGSIARTMKTENPYGRFLDSICGGIVDFAFWGIIGIMAFRHPQYLCWPNPLGYGSIFWLAIGFLTCFLFIWLGYIERTFDELLRPYWDKVVELGAKAMSSGAAPEYAKPAEKFLSTKNRKTLIRVINTNFRVRESHYVLLICAYCLRAVDFLLLAYFFYYLGHDILLLVVYAKRGRMLKRRSLSALRSIQPDN